MGAFHRKKDEIGVASISGYEPPLSTGEPTQPVFSFNPSKTFGGERTKLGIFPLKRPEDFTVPSVGIASKSAQSPELAKPATQPPLDIDFNKREERRPNVLRFITGMEALHKQFQDNQFRLEQSGGLVSTNITSYPYRFDEKKYI